MKLGPLQKLWIERLKAHPERQISHVLGHVHGKSYKACCLGEGIISCEIYDKKIKTGKEFFTINRLDRIYTDNAGDEVLTSEYVKKLSLRSEQGTCDDNYRIVINEDRSVELIPASEVVDKCFFRLSEINDAGVSWTNIAKLLEEHPSVFFLESR